MLAAETLLKLRTAHRALAVRIILDLGRLKHLPEGDRHSLGDGSGVLNDGHALSIRRRRGTLKGMIRVNSLVRRGFSIGLIFLCSIATARATHAQSPTPPMAGMDTAKPTAPASTSLTLAVDGKATTLTPAQLKVMPQKTVKVHNEHTKMDETYSGVLLSDLLTTAGFKVEQSTHRKMLRSYIKAQGTDKYWVLYSLTEVEPSEHDGDVLVALSMDGKGLGADGELKLISTGDKKPQRWVRNLTAITVVSAE
jgi:hypothetical protein